MILFRYMQQRHSYYGYNRELAEHSANLASFHNSLCRLVAAY